MSMSGLPLSSPGMDSLLDYRQLVWCFVTFKVCDYRDS